MGGKIMIVEDNELNSKLFHDLLKANFINYEIECYRSGAYVLELFSSQSYDIVLMDIQLPEISGLELIVEMKKVKNAVPIIVCTAFAMKGDEEYIRTFGAEEYLSKPISVIKFLATFRRYLNSG